MKNLLMILKKERSSIVLYVEVLQGTYTLLRVSSIMKPKAFAIA